MDIPTNPTPITNGDDVKIIKPGKLPQKERWRAGCQRCNCIFEFDEELPVFPSIRLTRPGRICPTPGCGVYVHGVPV